MQRIKASIYLRECKENLKHDECIILGDFAENYQFVVQDEVQSYHWNKEQCTLHPIVVYYISGRELVHKSFCFLSDDMEHDTSFFYKLQTELITILKEDLSQITSIKYFSDGCAAQYKNYKNFLNLCHHKEDSGLDKSMYVRTYVHGN